MENLARYVDKEEKTWVELIIRAHLSKRISQVARTGLVQRVKLEWSHWKSEVTRYLRELNTRFKIYIAPLQR